MTKKETSKAKTAAGKASKPKKKTNASKASKPNKAITVIDLSQYFGEIQQKAYDNFLERQSDNQSGNELSDWLYAENEISKKYISV